MKFEAFQSIDPYFSASREVKSDLAAKWAQKKIADFRDTHGEKAGKEYATELIKQLNARDALGYTGKLGGTGGLAVLGDTADSAAQGLVNVAKAVPPGSVELGRSTSELAANVLRSGSTPDLILKTLAFQPYPASASQPVDDPPGYSIPTPPEPLPDDQLSGLALAMTNADRSRTLALSMGIPQWKLSALKYGKDGKALNIDEVLRSLRRQPSKVEEKVGDVFSLTAEWFKDKQKRNPQWVTPGPAMDLNTKMLDLEQMGVNVGYSIPHMTAAILAFKFGGKGAAMKKVAGFTTTMYMEAANALQDLAREGHDPQDPATLQRAIDVGIVSGALEGVFPDWLSKSMPGKPLGRLKGMLSGYGVEATTEVAQTMVQMLGTLPPGEQVKTFEAAMELAWERRNELADAFQTGGVMGATFASFAKKAVSDATQKLEARKRDALERDEKVWKDRVRRKQLRRDRFENPGRVAGGDAKGQAEAEAFGRVAKAEAEEAVASIPKDILGGKEIVVHESLDAVPQDVMDNFEREFGKDQEPDAIADPDGKTIHIVNEFMESKQMVVEKVLHELSEHAMVDLKKKAPDEINAELETLYDTLDQWDIMDLVPEVYMAKAAENKQKLMATGKANEAEADAVYKREVATETLARLAEKVNVKDLSPDERTAWEKVVAWVKDFLLIGKSPIDGLGNYDPATKKFVLRTLRSLQAKPAEVEGAPKGRDLWFQQQAEAEAAATTEAQADAEAQAQADFDTQAQADAQALPQTDAEALERLKAKRREQERRAKAKPEGAPSPLDTIDTTPKKPRTKKPAAVPPPKPEAGLPPVGPKLPESLRRAKPRYNYGQERSYTPEFASDIDKALYIVGSKTRNKRYDDYMGWVSQHFKGENEAKIRQRGAAVRAQIKQTIKDRGMPPSGVLKIPQSAASQQVATQPTAKKPRTKKPAAAPSPLDALDTAAKKTDAAPEQPESKVGSKGKRQFDPEVREEIRKRVAGEKDVMSDEKFDALVEERMPWLSSVGIPTTDDFYSDKELRKALKANQREMVGKHRDLPKGTKIRVRLDIPAWRKSQVAVQTIHTPDKKVVGYDTIGHIDNPKFIVGKPMQKVGTGEPKAPAASVEGGYDPSRAIPEDLSSWTQVGYTPDRHDFFYDRATGAPVKGGDEAIIFGHTVFVKNPDPGERSDYKFSVRAGRKKDVFNFTIATEKIDIVRDMTKRGDIEGVQEANQAVVRHALADVPSKDYKIEIDNVQGVWDGKVEPSVSIKVEAKDGKTLNAIRARLSAVSAMFEQDELHEIKFDVSLPANVELGGRDGFDHYQPYAVITLDRKVEWKEVEGARRNAGILGASFDGEEILVYNTDDTPQVFADKVITLIGAINDAGRVRPTYRSGHVKIRRNARTHSPEDGIRGYAEGSILDGESSALATDIALRILRHTGGRLKAPDARSFFTAKDLTPQQIARQRQIADDYEAARFNDLKNPLVKRAYDAAATALVEQYREIIEGNLDIEIVPWERVENGKKVAQEPYPDSRAVVEDIRQNRRLRSLLTTPDAFGPEGVDYSDHPLLQPSGIIAKVMDAKGKFSEQEITVNDVLRVVHDGIAHGLFADTFGPVGEEGAWRTHIATISDPWARWAITSETRGQNSWVNYGPPVRDAEGNIEFDKSKPGFVSNKARGFAEQKAILLPIDHSFTGDKDIDAPMQELKDSLSDSQQQGSLSATPTEARFSVRKRPGTARYDNGKLPEGVHSTAYPWVVPKNRVADPDERHLVIGMDAASAKRKTAIADFIRKHFTMPDKTGTDDEVIRKATDFIVSNLLYLHDKMPADAREFARLWYDGANQLAHEWAGNYGLKVNQTAAIIAVNSPQTDWFVNLGRAERILETLDKYQDVQTTDAMIAFLYHHDRGGETGTAVEKEKRRIKSKEYADLIKGRTLRSLIEAGTKKEAAYFIRALNETGGVPEATATTGSDIAAFKEGRPPPTFQYVYLWQPDGVRGEIQRNAPTKKQKDAGLPGTPKKLAWGNYGHIEKSISVYLDSSRKTIDLALGMKHKVRSFFSNIMFPNGKWGDVTMDTHAVAGGELQAFAGSHLHVEANLQGTEVGSDGPRGVIGLYPLFADAYRLAARKRKGADGKALLPREMQSITWEAVRAIFTDTYKAGEHKKRGALKEKIAEKLGKDKKDVTPEDIREHGQGEESALDLIWEDYQNGNITLRQAQNRAVNAAGGFKLPAHLERASVEEGLRRYGGRGVRPTTPGGRGGNIRRPAGGRSDVEGRGTVGGLDAVGDRGTGQAGGVAADARFSVRDKRDRKAEREKFDAIQADLRESVVKMLESGDPDELKTAKEVMAILEKTEAHRQGVVPTGQQQARSVTSEDVPEFEMMQEHIDRIRAAGNIPTTVPDSEVLNTAIDRVKNAPDEARAKLMDNFSPSDADDIVTYRVLLSEIGMEVFRDGDVEKMADLFVLENEYREVGSEQGRAFRLRRERLLPPAEAMREFIARGLFAMDGKDQKAYRHARGRGDKKTMDEIKQKQVALVKGAREEMLRQGVDINELPTLDVTALHDQKATKHDPEYVKLLKDKKGNKDKIKAYVKDANEARRNAVIAVQKLAIVTRVAAQAKASYHDKFFEYWRNALMSALVTPMRNLVGNTGFMLWEYGPLRIWKGVMPGTGVGLWEAPTCWAAGCSAFAGAIRAGWLTYQTEMPIFDVKLGRKAPSEFAVTPAIGGIKLPLPWRAYEGGPVVDMELGRVIRTPMRSLLAADQFARHMVFAMETTAIANKIAGEDFPKLRDRAKRKERIEQIIHDPFNVAVNEAFDAVSAGDAALDKATYLTFQKEVKGIAKAAANLRSLKGDHNVATMWMARLHLPFVQTPYNIYATAVAQTPGLGALRLMSKSSRRAAGRSGGSGAMNIMAEQVLSLAALAGIAMLFYDEDDETGLPRITGSGLWERERMDELRLRGEVIPKQSIRFEIPGLDKKWWSYAGIEPFATVISTIADSLEVWDMRQRGMTKGEATKEWSSRFVGQVRDKTYLQGIGDLIRATEMRDPSTLIARQVSTWMPNIIRKHVSSKDDVKRDWRDRNKSLAHRANFAKRTGIRAYQMMLPGPEGAPGLDPVPAKVDWLGRELKRDQVFETAGSNYLWRMIAPFYSKDPKGVDRFEDRIEIMIVNYNNKRGRGEGGPDEWYPSLQHMTTFYRGWGLEPEDQTVDRWHDFLEESGDLTLKNLKKRDSRTKFNFKNPTPKDIADVKDILSKSRATIKKNMKDEIKQGK